MVCYIVSGYWAYDNGFGAGHLEMLRKVKSMMKPKDSLVVICSNEAQYRRKYKNFSRTYYEVYERIEPTLTQIFGNRWFTELSIDPDQTQRETLKYIKVKYKSDKKVFVNDGGEYSRANLPEMEVEGIEFLFLDNKKISNSGKEKLQWQQ